MVLDLYKILLRNSEIYKRKEFGKKKLLFFIHKKRQAKQRKSKKIKKHNTKRIYSFDFIYISGAVFVFCFFFFLLPQHLYLQLSLQTKRNHILLISMFVDLSLLDNHCGKKAHVNLILFCYVS